MCTFVTGGAIYGIEKRVPTKIGAACARISAKPAPKSVQGNDHDHCQRAGMQPMRRRARLKWPRNFFPPLAQLDRA